MPYAWVRLAHPLEVGLWSSGVVDGEWELVDLNSGEELVTIDQLE
jgi:hypothetical protein